MRLSFRCIDTLPRLAWCARLTKSQDTVEVFHGPWVETTPDFFCEGAWNGDFASGEFESGILMGSGGKIVGDRFVVASPCHTMERLFVLKQEKTLLVSNSLVFVLASADDKADPHALMYSVKLASVSNGLKGYSRWLPTFKGNRVRVYYHCNLLIDANLNVVEEPKKTFPDFVGFADYKAFLIKQVQAIHANANDPRRKVVYRPISTISSGYDSPTATVIAREVGCNEALTFVLGRAFTSDDTDIDDSGSEIARKLGMRIYEFDRLAYLEEKGFPEADFFGWGAQEAPWAKLLEGRILFTGHHGDRTWGRTVKKVTTTIERPGGPSGHNLENFRLRVGWIHLPVPFLGVTSHPSIYKISNSKEMAPWTLNNDYDRPIPRRLLEEAGVERHMFGVKKRAAGVDLVTEGLRGLLTVESFDDYNRYYSRHWTQWMTVKQRIFMILKEVNLFYQGYSDAATEVLKKRVGVNVRFPMLIPRDIRIGNFGNLDNLVLLVPWSIEKLLPRYTINAGGKPKE